MCKRLNKNLLEQITENYDGGNYFLIIVSKFRNIKMSSPFFKYSLVIIVYGRKCRIDSIET